MNETTLLLERLLLQVAVDAFFILYVGFFALHAAQRISDPSDRTGWLLLIVVLHVFGTTLYVLTKWRKFRAIGKGNLIGLKRYPNRFWLPKEFFELSDAEKSN